MAHSYRCMHSHWISSDTETLRESTSKQKSLVDFQMWSKKATSCSFLIWSRLHLPPFSHHHFFYQSPPLASSPDSPIHLTQEKEHRAINGRDGERKRRRPSNQREKENGIHVWQWEKSLQQRRAALKPTCFPGSAPRVKSMTSTFSAPVLIEYHVSPQRRETLTRNQRAG